MELKPPASQVINRKSNLLSVFPVLGEAAFSLWFAEVHAQA
jgi:hypothetical protein